MDTNVNYTVVGAFVIILFTFICLAVIWLSSGFSIGGYATYMVYMQEAVTGLSPDASVEFNGVKVGNVQSIEIDKQNPHLVQLVLSVEKDTPITQGTVATLNAKGLTGVTYIALKDEGKDLRPLRALKGQPYPVIKTGPSLFLQLDAALTKLNTSLSQVSNSIQSVLDEENRRQIKNILLNLDEITNTLAINSQKLNTIVANTARASQQFAPIIQSGKSTMQLLETQTLPATNRILENLNALVRNLNEITATMRQNPAVIVRGVSGRPLGPGESR